MILAALRPIAQRVADRGKIIVFHDRKERLVSVDPLMAQTGMDVYGSDAEHLGQVRNVRPDGIVVAQTDEEREYLIPRDYLDQVSEADYRVDLSISGDEAKQFVVGG